MRDEVYEIEARVLLQNIFLRDVTTDFIFTFSSQLLCQADSAQVCAEGLPASCIFDGGLRPMRLTNPFYNLLLCGLSAMQPQN